MTEKISYEIRQGFEAGQSTKIARLFWQAFKGKLFFALGPEEKALGFLKSVVNADYAFSAVDADGEVLGVAGFKTKAGAFIGGGMTDLFRTYGVLGAIWRAAVLILLERPVEDAILLMDGIFVSDGARGQGVGSALLNAIKNEAKVRDCSKVRLDVIDSNPRARALYERQGFIAGETVDIGLLKSLFGFQKVTTMIFEVK